MEITDGIDFGKIVEIIIDSKRDPNGNYKVRWVLSSGIIIEGGRIGPSKKYKGWWVQVPSFRIGNGKFFKPIKINNDKLMRQIKKATEEALGQSLEPEEEIDIDSIPF